MATIKAFDFSVNLVRAILWQYNNATNLQSLITQKETWYRENHTTFWEDWYTDVFNIRTANEFGLTVWANILNFPIPEDSEFTEVATRQDEPENTAWAFVSGADDFNEDPFNGNLRTAFLQREVLSGDTPNDGTIGLSFESRVTQEPEPEQPDSETEPPDFAGATLEQKRSLIILRWLTLIYSPTVFNINLILQTAFGRNQWTFEDVVVGPNMTIRYTALTQEALNFITVLRNTDALPRPDGVLLTFEDVTSITYSLTGNEVNLVNRPDIEDANIRLRIGDASPIDIIDFEFRDIVLNSGPDMASALQTAIRANSGGAAVYDNATVVWTPTIVGQGRGTFTITGGVAQPVGIENPVAIESLNLGGDVALENYGYEDTTTTRYSLTGDEINLVNQPDIEDADIRLRIGDASPIDITDFDFEDIALDSGPNLASALQTAIRANSGGDAVYDDAIVTWTPTIVGQGRGTFTITAGTRQPVGIEDPIVIQSLNQAGGIALEIYGFEDPARTRYSLTGDEVNLVNRPDIEDADIRLRIGDASSIDVTDFDFEDIVLDSGPNLASALQTAIRASSGGAAVYDNATVVWTPTVVGQGRGTFTITGGVPQPVGIENPVVIESLNLGGDGALETYGFEDTATTRYSLTGDEINLVNQPDIENASIRLRIGDASLIDITGFTFTGIELDSGPDMAAALQTAIRASSGGAAVYADATVAWNPTDPNLGEGTFTIAGGTRQPSGIADPFLILSLNDAGGIALEIYGFEDPARTRYSLTGDEINLVNRPDIAGADIRLRIGNASPIDITAFIFLDIVLDSGPNMAAELQRNIRADVTADPNNPPPRGIPVYDNATVVWTPTAVGQGEGTFTITGGAPQSVGIEDPVVIEGLNPSGVEALETYGFA